MNRQQQVIDINGFQVNVMDIEDKENEMIQFDKTNDMVQDFMTRTSINTEYLGEKIVSQKLSQLSITTTAAKQQLPTVKHTNSTIRTIPNFLSKKNQSFREMIKEFIPVTATAISNRKIAELRQIAISLYRIMFVELHHNLWTIYFKSGMGTLIIETGEQSNYSTNIHIWPREIQLKLSECIYSNQQHKDETYIEFVVTYLNELDNQLRQYENELKQKTNNCSSYSHELEHLIKTYIEKNLSLIRLEIEHKIELVYFNYHIQSLKVEYYRYNPNEYQKQLMKQLCSSKYEQEITEHVYHLLEQQIIYCNSSCQSFECSSLSNSALINSIQDGNTRRQLHDQYQTIAKQSKINILNLYVQTAKIQMNESKNKFDTNIKKIWDDYQSSSDKEKIPLIMINLIEQRCSKISERIKCIYQHKAQTIHCNFES